LLLPPRGGSASTLWGFRQHIQKTKYEPQRTISRSDDPTPTQTRSSIRGPFIRNPDPCRCQVFWLFFFIIYYIY
jgi:hypothetical protein